MAQVGLAQVWSSWQARAHPKRDTGSGRWTSGSRAVTVPLARPSRQPPPPDSATSAPHAPARRAGHRRTVPLVPRATRPAHDADGTAEWHRWVLAQVWPDVLASEGAPQEGHRHKAAGVWEQVLLRLIPCCHEGARKRDQAQPSGRANTRPLQPRRHSRLCSARAGQACRPPPDSATSATRNTAGARCGWDR